MCAAADDQQFPIIVSDGAETAIVTWSDARNGNSDIFAQQIGGTPVGVEPITAGRALDVQPNHPNPFARSTDFQVRLPRDSDVQIDVFDVSGRRVRSFVAAGLGSGWQRIGFSGVDDAGRPLASGVYFYRVRAAGETATRKMVIAR